MTLLGLTGVRTIVQEEKMAAATQDRNLAFQAAEAALREGEAAVATLVAADQVPADGSDDQTAPHDLARDPQDPSHGGSAGRSDQFFDPIDDDLVFSVGNIGIDDHHQLVSAVHICTSLWTTALGRSDPGISGARGLRKAPSIGRWNTNFLIGSA